MSDPLSVISAIVGILAAAGKVVEVLGPYVSAAKDTPKIARSVHSEVVHSRIILSALHGLLDNLSLMSGSRTDIVQLDDLITVFTNGVLIFNELEESVLKINQAGGDRLMARMQWVRKEGDFSAFITRLQTFKATTLLLLNILQCDSDRRATQNYVELSGKLMKLLENTKLSSRMETLEDSFDALSLVEAKRPIQSQSAVPCLSDHQSDMDDQSFYSVETTKPNLKDQKVEPIATLNESSFAIPTFEFQADLDDSVPYRRARVGTIDLSTKGSVAASNTWSVFSGVSLSEVSILSRVAIPVFPQDISNSHHYEFIKPTTKKLYTSRRPTEAMMGNWARSVRRVSRLRELRFDVQFEAPVIFLCPPENRRGPLKNQPIYYIDGSQVSCDETWSELPSAPPVRAAARSYHTDDLVTWVTLLSALQKMENESRGWQQRILDSSKSHSSPSETHTLTSSDIDEVTLRLSQRYTLAVGVQRKLKQWSELPLTCQRPTAVTTWTHAIELAAILGIYWKEFNRSQEIYRAQGNGYTVRGFNLPEQGTVFTFQITGVTSFESNRVIPRDEIKFLCFGFVPTIFWLSSGRPDAVFSRRRPDAVFGSQPTPELLHLASAAQMTQSLLAIGCNSFTSKLFLGDKTVSHIFPIVFEIIGMLAQSVHIKDSVFRMLPNPTQYTWRTAGFSLNLMIPAFVNQLNESRILIHDAANSNYTFIHRKISQNAREIVEHMRQRADEASGVDLEPDVYLMNLLHESVADTTEVLTACNAREHVMRGVIPSEAKDTLHENRERLRSRRRNLTLLILRNHIQVVLAGLNEGTTSESQVDVRAGDGLAPSPAWEELDYVPPELKQAKLMEIYFRLVRPKVVAEVEKLAGDLHVSFPAESNDHGTSTVVEDEKGGALNDMPLWKVENVSCEDIWYTLVFRSICWLMLHDFHPDDVQIPKSDLFGSRLPVYIA